MKDRLFWKVIAVGVVLGLFAIAYGLLKNSQSPSPPFASAAYAAETAPKKPEARPGVMDVHFTTLDYNGSFRVQRVKVTGGWFLYFMPRDALSWLSVTFYPDPDHKWDGKGLP